jgi:hypothetical protein
MLFFPATSYKNEKCLKMLYLMSWLMPPMMFVSIPTIILILLYFLSNVLVAALLITEKDMMKFDMINMMNLKINYLKFNIMTGLLTNLEIPKQNVQSQKLLTTIENSLCEVCEKEFTEKDIKGNNFVLVLASRNNKISSANISLSIKSFRHERCPRKYRD